MLPVIKVALISYVKLISMLGSEPDIEITKNYLHDNIPPLFSKNITKINNGKINAKGWNELYDQLLTAREISFPWNIEIIDEIIDKEEHKIVVSYNWSSKIGNTTVIAILELDTKNKIEKIYQAFDENTINAYYIDEGFVVINDTTILVTLRQKDET